MMNLKVQDNHPNKILKIINQILKMKNMIIEEVKEEMMKWMMNLKIQE